MGFANVELLVAWECLRKSIGLPITVNSGFRCAKHNKEVGGTLTSRHLFGQAVDMVCKDFDLSGDDGIRAMLNAGFQGIGRGSGWVHGDVRTSGYAFWKYENGQRVKDPEAEAVYEKWRT